MVRDKKWRIVTKPTAFPQSLNLLLFILVICVYIYERGKCGSGKSMVILSKPPHYTGHNNPD